MKFTDRLTIMAVGGLVSTLVTSLPLAAAVYTFGSANDGLAGFTRSTADPAQETWLTLADSVRYINADPDGIDTGVSGGTRDATLLREIVLDRSVGSSYYIRGTVHLTDGYADDNNRVGIYLFGDYADLTGPGGPVPSDEEAGALALIYNLDVGRNHVLINQGLDGPNQALEVKDAGLLGEDLFGTTLAFGANIDFVDVGGMDYIDVAFTLTDALNDTTTISTQVLAADYIGDYFGFGTRARNRGTTSLDRVEDFTMDYETFSITPEPATISLIAVMGGALMVRRRRSAL